MVWPNLLLVVLDGWGCGDGSAGDAIAHARTPALDSLNDRFPSTVVEASGVAVGLPPGQMGNSEVGHSNLGAGRVVKQDLVRIDEACRADRLQDLPPLEAAVARVLGRGGRLHLLGLASDGGVHSRFDHAMAIADHAVSAGVDEVVIHGFLDGRDVLPKSAGEYFRDVVEPWAATRPEVSLGTVVGRYFAMDRDRRWERTERTVELLLRGSGRTASNAHAAISASYDESVTDEFIEPVPLDGMTPIEAAKDVVIFFNFRPDRARQLTSRLTEEGVDLVTMTRYDAEFPNPVLFPPDDVQGSIPEVIAAAGRRHLHAAETEKYAHVTYFFAGGREIEFPGEVRLLVPSRDDVPTYDLAPEMSAPRLTREVVDAWRTGFDFGIVNFANPDMVGHTGDLRAAVQAIEVVDSCLGSLFEAVQATGGVLVLTADHGNAEHMVEPDGTPNTAHTTNPVPVLVTDAAVRLRAGGVLADVGPTVLEVLGVEAPPAMTAASLIT